MPVDLGSTTSTCISAFAYARLLEHLQYPVRPIVVADMVQFLPKISEQVRQRFQVDAIMLHPAWTAIKPWTPRPGCDFMIPAAAKLTPHPQGGWEMEHQGGGKSRMPEGGFFFDGSWGRVDERTPEAHFGAMVEEAKRLHEETDYYVGWGGFPAFFGNQPDFLCDLMLEPEKIAARNRLILENAKASLLKVAAACGDAIQDIRISDDMGTQQGPMCRPEVMEREIAPFYKEFCTFVHENSPYKVHLHCCGSILPLLPMLIDCGIDIIDPVQISANNMAPQALKAATAGKLALWGGGANPQHFLDSATPEQVRAHVRENITVFKPGGGYVFAPVHNIQGNVPPENVVAMFDTANEMAAYG
jgi:uroporphyrinogen decarboxylase